MGFWSNQNGQAAMENGPGGMRGALRDLRDLNLRNADGSHFNPKSYEEYRDWLLNASATNMAYMLSAQLSAMFLNVRQGFVNGNSLIYAPGTNSADASGFATVNAIITEANNELGVHGVAREGIDAWWAYQRNLKDALDNANNNESFLQGWCSTRRLADGKPPAKESDL